MKIEFFRHDIIEDDIKRVNEVLRSIFLTTGEYVNELERKFSNYLGCREVVGLTSCTAALHLSLLAFGIGRGDDVITTPLTFIATANAILHAGAKPVFVDVEPDTGNINASLIEAAITPRTKAIIPVHLYGQLCDMVLLRKIADRYNLVVIEDAAHSIESIREGVRPGQLGDVACFSFYATKNITSGEGGAIATNNSEIADRIRTLRLHGMSKGASERYVGKYKHWDMEICGWKYNMDNIQAALLIGQLERIEEQLAIRETIARRYEEAFSGIEGLDFPKVVPGSKSARHLFTIWVDPKRRDTVLWDLQNEGIGVAVNFRAIHLLKFYREQYGYNKGAFPVAEKIGDSTISIPLYPGLKQEEIIYIIETVKKVVK